ncbi:DUF2179 domain-containing protein [Mycoplasmopsis cricetuli]|uniref:DUF2179 domain-containing protein n=1 Tax=Mycoplasmopsis cricetuli TaxID=171283 RepID=UPI000471B5C4|nr:DUF2179 domain-containing protein [Mycoplasmopsis cricetuli]
MLFLDHDSKNEKCNESCKIIKKQNTIYKKTRMSNFGLKLNYFYSQLPTWKLISITFITAVVFGIISVFFVKNVGIYNFGLAAFGQAFARLIVVNTVGVISNELNNAIDQAVFWIAYIILSIPIFIFGYKKIGKLFGHLTVVFLFVSSSISFLIGFIPGANNIYIIGNFGNQEIKNLLISMQNNTTSLEIKQQIISLSNLTQLIPLSWNDGGNTLALILIAIVYGVILAWIFALIQIIGGTAGVTGIIGEWYSNTKHKSFGTISGNLNIIIIFISVAIGSWLPGSILIQKIVNLANQIGFDNNNETLEILQRQKWSFEFYLSPNFVATILTNVAYILVLNKIYPKFKLVKIEVYSKKYTELEHAIIEDRKMVITLTSFMAKTGKEEKDINILKSITLFRQVPRILKKIHKIDPEALTVVSDVQSIDGYIYLPNEKF